MRRTSANTGSRAVARLPRPVASPSSAGSIYCLRPVPHSVPQPALPATAGSTSEPTGPRPVRVHTPEVANAESNRRTTRHTTHHQHLPERVTITRPHHPFEGQSLEVLRQARMPAGLQLLLILPDGSKSLIPADWTDFETPAGLPQGSSLVASLDDLLRLRVLTDALLRRS